MNLELYMFVSTEKVTKLKYDKQDTRCFICRYPSIKIPYFVVLFVIIVEYIPIINLTWSMFNLRLFVMPFLE